MNNSDQYLLSMQTINKSFPGVQALDNVTFEVIPGEIHALIGENGAGKSTLMRVLSGVFLPDSGTIYWKGHPVQISKPSDAQEIGISMIHQELAVIPYLDVGKNIFLGREPQIGIPGIIDWKKLYEQAHEQLDRLDLNIDPKAEVQSLTIAQQQMVEVVKALSMDASLIIMDEPTSALTEQEVEALFDYMKHLRKQGVSIIFISHRLEEVYKISDRITILRDGNFIGTNDMKALTPDDVVKMMVGRKIDQTVARETKDFSDVILSIENLSSGSEVKEINFNLHKGEILGIAGLVGAGRTALAEVIFGARDISDGKIWLDGKVAKIKSPSHAILSGLGFITEDRKGQGLFMNMAVWQNIIIAAIKGFTKAGFINRNDARQQSVSMIDKLDIRTSGVSQKIANLSGGNQQKVIIARWLLLEPKVLILDEPTRGIDVGAKAEIHNLLKQMADEGVGIIMISSELPELLGVSDRVLVMREGRLVADLDPHTATQDDIMHAAAGSKNGNN